MPDGRIQGEMRGILAQLRFDGDLQAFFRFVREDPQFYLPEDEAGRAVYLERSTAVIEDMKTRLDGLFLRQPKADLIVKATEAYREKTAAKAFYQRPAPNGARPGVYYVTLYNRREMPTYQLEAIAYHQGIPGHHMQIAIAQELEDVPSFRRFGFQTAYIEGWALYCELLPKEIGLYADPYSDFGRLAMELWRAVPPPRGRHRDSREALDAPAGDRLLRGQQSALRVGGGPRDRAFHHDSRSGDQLQDRHDQDPRAARPGAAGTRHAFRPPRVP